MPQQNTTHSQTTPGIDLAEVFDRTPRGPSVLVADGYGLRIQVEGGHLVVHDGIGTHRRTRRLPRAQRAVRRLLILGHSGGITLDALAWCNAVGVSVAQLDPITGHVLLAVGAAGRDDPRLRRAQALAANRSVGVTVTRALIGAKISRQSEVLRRLGEPVAADRLDIKQASLDAVTELRIIAGIESQAANSYFGMWTRHVAATFATRDRARVPEHWLGYDGRRSVLDYGRSPRKAATPVNAILNYCYALAEAECRTALVAVGLDPGLGIMHTDKLARDSLALDILEPIRPIIDGHVLDLLDRRRFRAADFHETPDGHCRILPPLTHELAEESHRWVPCVAMVAEDVAHMLARDSAAPIPLRTPLTGSNHRAANRKSSGRRARKQPASAARMPRTCRDCGSPLESTSRELCATCWPVARATLAAGRARRGAAAIAAARAKGQDPTNTPDAKAKRHASLVVERAARDAWDNANPEADRDPELSQGPSFPDLARVPLSAISHATGLSLSAASRIRRGQLRPHPRHWAALAALTPQASSEALRTTPPPNPS